MVLFLIYKFIYLQVCLKLHENDPCFTQRPYSEVAKANSLDSLVLFLYT